MIAALAINISLIAIAVVIHYEMLRLLSVLIPRLRIKHRLRVLIGDFGTICAHIIETCLRSRLLPHGERRSLRGFSRKFRRQPCRQYLLLVYQLHDRRLRRYRSARKPPLPRWHRSQHWSLPYHLVCVIDVYGDDTILEWRLNLFFRSCVGVFSSCASENAGQPIVTLVTRIFIKFIFRRVETHFAAPVLGIIRRV